MLPAPSRGGLRTSVYPLADLLANPLTLEAYDEH